MKSAIPTASWDSTFFVNINFVNCSGFNWSRSKKLGLITFLVCELFERNQACVRFLVFVKDKTVRTMPNSANVLFITG